MRAARTLALLGIVLTATLLPHAAMAQSRLTSHGSDVVSALAENDCAKTSVANVQDRNTARAQERASVREVDTDIDRTMIGLLLMDQGATDISARSLSNITTRFAENDTLIADSVVDRQSVFSAVTLGIAGVASTMSALDALTCLSSVTATAPATDTYARTVDIDIDDALIATVLTRRGATPTNLRDIATIHETTILTNVLDQDVSIAARDALTLLTLG